MKLVAKSKEFSLVAYLVNAIPSQPEAVGLLACLVDRGVVTIDGDTSDGGAQLAYLGAAKKHLRLVSALIKMGAAVAAHVDVADGGMSVLHAAIGTDLMVADMVQKLLSERSPERERGHCAVAGNAGRAGRKKTRQQTERADALPPAYGDFVLALARSCARHLPFAAHSTLASSIQALFSDDDVDAPAAARPSLAPVEAFLGVGAAGAAAAAATAAATSPPPPPPPWRFACTRTLAARHLRDVANGLASLLVRLLLEAQLAGLRGRMLLDAAKTHPAAAAAPAELLRRLLSAVSRRDLLGRTPLHAAARAGNAAAARLLLATAFAAVNETVVFLQLPGPGAAAVKASGGAASVFVQFNGVSSGRSSGDGGGGDGIGAAADDDNAAAEKKRRRALRMGAVAASRKVAALLRARDALNASAADAAEWLGHTELAQLLRTSLAQADARSAEPREEEQQRRQQQQGPSVGPPLLLQEYLLSHDGGLAAAPAAAAADAAGSGWPGDGDEAEMMVLAHSAPAVQAALQIARRRALAGAASKDAAGAESDFANACDSAVEVIDWRKFARSNCSSGGNGTGGDDASPCVEAPLSPQQFVTAFAARSRPVLLRGYFAPSSSLRQALAAKRLLADYGDLVFPVASTPYARAFGGTVRESSLRDFAAVAIFGNSAGGAAGANATRHPAHQQYVFDAPGSRGGGAAGADSASAAVAAAEGGGGGGGLPRWLSDPHAAALLERVWPLVPALLQAARVPVRDDALYDALVAGGGPALDLDGLARALGEEGRPPLPGAGGSGGDALLNEPSAAASELRSRLVDAALQRAVASVASDDAASNATEAAPPAEPEQQLSLPRAEAAAPRSQPLLDEARSPPKPQFFLGPPGSGAPMHFHKDAVNLLAHGQKRWFLLPPPWALYSSVPVADWLVQAFGEGGAGGGAQAASGWKAHLHECTQNAGDLMYVPYGWGHAVLNTHASVGFAVEFTTTLASRG